MRKRRSSPVPSRLVFGLGNPGRRYAGTYHNAGFLAVDLLAVSAGIRLRSSGEAEVGVGLVEGATVLLGKPKTYMNLSGRAVAPVYGNFAGSPEDLVVLHDDLDLALGVVRLKRGGGTGGHNGLRSLKEELGTGEFLRVRVGIGRPPEGVDPSDFVLSPVPEESQDRFRSGVSSAAEAVTDILREGFDKASTSWNARRA
ncbi:MAG: aminoacyl-tRNA hydrolase, partial [Deltaproteobacteria bacterium]|nr:aminoacyl-tRNA hydrolase [Deltaproteobacteria bacterium]